MNFFTIGVFSLTEKEFFEKLTNNNIDTFCDIRQHRGVRGATYSFVNSNKLQQKLKDMGIKYCYISSLAPTTEIRNLQKEIDLKKGESISKRRALGKEFIREYKNKILKKFNFSDFFELLDRIGSKRIILFCVEKYPEACHRSIISNELDKKYKYFVTHL